MNKPNYHWTSRLLCVLAAVSVCGCGSPQIKERDSFDVVVLGGTSAGVAAAVAERIQSGRPSPPAPLPRRERGVILGRPERRAGKETV